MDITVKQNEFCYLLSIFSKMKATIFKDMHHSLIEKIANSICETFFSKLPSDFTYKVKVNKKGNLEFMAYYSLHEGYNIKLCPRVVKKIKGVDCPLREIRNQYKQRDNISQELQDEIRMWEVEYWYDGGDFCF